MSSSQGSKLEGLDTAKPWKNAARGQGHCLKNFVSELFHNFHDLKESQGSLSDQNIT